MPRTLRTVYFWIAAAAFAVLAPAVVLYTMGFRFDTQRGALYATGVLSVTTIPRSATVHVNGQAVGKTPLRLEHVTPGWYTIEVSHDGFAPWKKNLAVRANTATLAHNLLLFAMTPSRTPLLTAPVRSWTTSPDARAVAFVRFDDAGTILTRIVGAAAAESIHLPTEPASLSWSADHRHILMEFPASASAPARKAVWLNSGAVIDVPTGKRAAISWDAADPNRLIEVQGRQLRITFLPELTVQTYTLPRAYDHVVVRGTHVYGVTEPSTQTSRLWSFDLERRSSERRIATLDGQGYQLQLLVGSPFIIAHQPSGSLVVLDPNDRYPVRARLDGVDALWPSVADSELLVWRAYELYTLNLEDGDASLVTRLAHPIRSARWFPDRRFVLIDDAERITAVEVDRRDHQNTYVVVDDPADVLMTDGRGRQITIVLPDHTLQRVDVR